MEHCFHGELEYFDVHFDNYRRHQDSEFFYPNHSNMPLIVYHLYKQESLQVFAELVDVHCVEHVRMFRYPYVLVHQSEYHQWQ